MKHPAIAVSGIALGALLAVAQPALAQEDGQSRLRGLFDDMLGTVSPFVSELTEMLGDLSGWHMPERLPNGDILIRRRDEAQEPEVLPESEPEAGPDGILEL